MKSQKKRLREQKLQRPRRQGKQVSSLCQGPVKTNGPDEKARPPEDSLAIRRSSLGAISGLGSGWDQARATTKPGTQGSVCCQAPEKCPRGS